MEVWRLVFGHVTKSVLSINVFRSLDTTEIYYMPLWEVSEDLMTMEYIVTDYVTRKKYLKYCLNRVMGGNTDVDFEIRSDMNRLATILTDDDYRRMREISHMFSDLEQYRRL